MAILRGQKTANVQPYRLSNPTVDRSIRAWEQRIEAAEAAAFERAKAEVAQEFAERIATAEAAQADAQKALKDGIAQAEAEWNAKWGPVLGALSRLVTDQQSLQEAALKAAEADTIQLACAMAARVVQQAIETPEWMAPAVLAHAHDVPDRRQVSIRMHPNDAELVSEHLAQEFADASEAMPMPTIVGDAAMKRGSCIMESAGTTIDLSAPGAWERMVADIAHIMPDADRSVPAADNGSGPVAIPEELIASPATNEQLDDDAPSVADTEAESP